MGRSKIPTVISCGMSSLDEINEIKSYKKGGGKIDITSLYFELSSSNKDINLKE